MLTTTISIDGIVLRAGACKQCGLKIYPASQLPPHRQYHRLMDLAARTAGKHMPAFNPVNENHKLQKIAGIRNPVGNGPIWSKTWDLPPSAKGEGQSGGGRRKLTVKERSRKGAAGYWRKIRALPIREQGKYFRERSDKRMATIAKRRAEREGLEE